VNNILQYPLITKFLLGGTGYEDTFIYDRYKRCNPKDEFWLHFEYFLQNKERFQNIKSIIERILINVPLDMEIGEAWGKWRNFRSAQAEVTTFFLIENYFKGKILEIIPVSNSRTPDFKVLLNDKEYLIEIKAQSGQQQGSIHPRDRYNVSFYQYSPQDENDLRSWLFSKETISRRDNKPMVPKIVEAHNQGADILVVMQDHYCKEKKIKKQAALICENSEYIESKDMNIENGQPLEAHFFRCTFPILNLKVKEIWLFKESCLNRFIVLSQESVLLSHLNKNFLEEVQDKREV